MNTSLWDPHLALHVVGSTVYAVEKGTFVADQDIGEIFLKFILSK